jgi:hypothetical protein
MSVPDEKTIQREYVDLLCRSGFPITDAEWEAMEISDFGLIGQPAFRGVCLH